jgi:hypothetical protein
LRASWQRYHLALALDDDDHTQIRELVADPIALDAHERVSALMTIERDDLALVAIGDALEHPDGSIEAPELRRDLDELRERHAPYARAGGTYEYITGFDGYGPDAGAAHDLGPFRMMYSASARQLESADPGLLRMVDGPRPEAEGVVVGRRAAPHRVTELGAGFTYQSDGPLPRASFFDQRLFARELALTVQAGADQRIDDTAFLRVAGVRNQLVANLRAELPARTYVSGELEIHDDHTRHLHSLGFEVSETAEAGYRITSSSPEWDVGLQAIASQRTNPDGLPNDVLTYAPRGSNIDLLLPPSYELISVVTHFVRGDFLERYRPDRGSFPRYDCEAGIGLLLPDGDAAAHVQCSVSARVAFHGYVSAVGLYNWGFAGIDNQKYAQASLSFTQPF